MNITKVSTNGGKTWNSPLQQTFREEFDLNRFNSAFVNQGANSWISFAQGDKLLEIGVQDGFTLEVSGTKLVVRSYQELDTTTIDTIDLDVPSAMLIIAPNGGGIGIADIRDQGFRVRGFVFDIKDSLISVPSNQGTQITIYFSHGYSVGPFAVPMPTPPAH